jgi:hypothetical protein
MRQFPSSIVLSGGTDTHTFEFLRDKKFSKKYITSLILYNLSIKIILLSSSITATPESILELAANDKPI